MITRTLTMTSAVAAVLLAIAGCAIGPTSRTDVCQQFDELGTDYLAANGFFDNLAFGKAGDLANAAGRYQGTPDLAADATALTTIANSTSTTGADLINATTQIAELCGHPLGVGTTDYGSGDSNEAAPNYENPAYNTPDYQDSPTTTESVPPTTTAPEGVTDETSAQAALQQQVNNDRPSVEALVGQWVPQLSSKAYGMVADGVTYDYLQIWQDFESIGQQHPGALLLWSGDYRSFQLTNYWVTILPTSYPSGAQAASWCTSNGLGANDCYAKLISHTSGPKGSSVNP